MLRRRLVERFAAALLVAGDRGPFAYWLLGLSLIHQVLKQSLLYERRYIR